MEILPEERQDARTPYILREEEGKATACKKPKNKGEGITRSYQED